ncbi:MAG: ChaB family protein [Wenzhouxiangellaceae bacterium]|nr:ChaB family protein [Wenzhouxiangellaceae bacterium]
MPYKKNEDLPESVTDKLPDRAQTIYRKAFNSAWDEYADPSDRRGDSSREQIAHRVAWSAVKKEYEKGSNGRWVRKSD